jgi:hypothetical protein
MLVNCAKAVLPAMTSTQWCYHTPQFHRFPIAKGGTKIIAHLPIFLLMGF